MTTLICMIFTSNVFWLLCSLTDLQQSHDNRGQTDRGQLHDQTKISLTKK